MANKTRSIKIGAVTYPSITAAHKTAVNAALRNGTKPPSYITFYQRLRAGNLTPSKALVKPVRKYHLVGNYGMFEDQMDAHVA